MSFGGVPQWFFLSLPQHLQFALFFMQNGILENKVSPFIGLTLFIPIWNLF